MAEKDALEAKKSVAPKKSVTKKAPAKKAASKASTGKKSQEYVAVEDMYRLLTVLEDGLASRDKATGYLQRQIELNQEQVAQNKKILAKRGLIYKLSFALLAIGVVVVGFDQHTIIKSFDKDMTTVARDMDVMMKEMTAMRIAMESMSTDMHSMSSDFSTVAKDVSSIAKDVSVMTRGVVGMSRDTRDMNRSIDTMTPPWSPFR